MAEKTENKDAVVIKKSSLKVASFLVVAFIIGIVIGGSFIWMFATKPSSTGLVTGQISASDASQKVVKYINENLVQPGETVTLVSTEDAGIFFKITTLYQNTKIPVYATKDGTMLFLSAPSLLNETVPTPTPTATTIPKANNVTAELFVMAFCPYGVQAENIMKDVVDVIGSKADIKVRFIASVGGTTTDSVQSLHGATEAQEDLRQICIMKYYPDKYWSYLMDINQNCYTNARNATALGACWKAAAQKQGIDVSKIETCSTGQEGLNLLKQDEAAADKYSVTGSPTLIINGAVYSGSRTADAFKNAICSGFNSPPAECGQVINSTQAAAAQGGCA